MRVAYATFGSSLRTRETVLMATPAAFATSWMVLRDIVAAPQCGQDSNPSVPLSSRMFETLKSSWPEVDRTKGAVMRLMSAP